MVCVYSVRAKARPTVSTPVAWDEVSEAVDRGDAAALSFEMTDVVERIAERGDLFAPVLELPQELASASGATGAGASS
jgi:bifunctional non-homologous end joining protein LigD